MKQVNHGLLLKRIAFALLFLEEPNDCNFCSRIYEIHFGNWVMNNGVNIGFNLGVPIVNSIRDVIRSHGVGTGGGRIMLCHREIVHALRTRQVDFYDGICGWKEADNLKSPFPY